MGGRSTPILLLSPPLGREGGSQPPKKTTYSAHDREYNNKEIATRRKRGVKSAHFSHTAKPYGSALRAVSPFLLRKKPTSLNFYVLDIAKNLRAAKKFELTHSMPL